jgi:hypothetical protein
MVRVQAGVCHSLNVSGRDIVYRRYWKLLKLEWPNATTGTVTSKNQTSFFKQLFYQSDVMSYLSTFGISIDYFYAGLQRLYCRTEKGQFELLLSLFQHAGKAVLHFSQAVCKTVIIKKNLVAVVLVIHVLKLNVLNYVSI